MFCQIEGLFKINNNSKKQEVIKLTYKDGDILYISIHSLHKIAKFSSKEGVEPKINQLGSPAWKRTKEKTIKEHIQSMLSHIEDEELRSKLENVVYKYTNVFSTELSNTAALV